MRCALSFDTPCILYAPVASWNRSGYAAFGELPHFQGNNSCFQKWCRVFFHIKNHGIAILRSGCVIISRKCCNSINATSPCQCFQGILICSRIWTTACYYGLAQHINHLLECYFDQLPLMSHVQPQFLLFDPSNNINDTEGNLVCKGLLIAVKYSLS